HGAMSTVQPELHFWYEFASTYSYPAAMRIEDAAHAAGVQLVWRPFLLGPIFFAQGWNDSPFNIYPVKGAYMWRDLARVCAKHGLPLRRPSRFPRNGLLAARVALLAADEGWCGAFTRAVYHASFAEDREISDREVIADILARLGRNPDDVLARAQTPEHKERLKHQNDEAVARGIF